ncbi:NAD-dependent epimerase/dehydratase family protein [Microbacterium sp. TNHR37B]|uniref:NAD-dependent epimerase/dehydratase family protein n=1 Tax=Microbacterium sp. TNHR37B TaxID=1775956 RepID=UPI0007B1779C|nr:NAD-dependent epimerase/dehydratase family protein [Microbacterium sp. TNHR37B]KZE90211.1 hypothetical protein AVP41_01621 [Microbacterium sp. TNHR37B]
MRRILILGGTGWLSGRVARRWTERGAEVVCLARGSRPAPAGATLVAADRSRPDAYAAVAAERWDDVIDISSRPGHVRAALAALAPRSAHWTYVSSVSVYADNETPGADETAAVATPVASDHGADADYAGAKAAAEAAVAAAGLTSAIIRPGLIVGPGDPTDRFGYWPARFAAAGAEPVLVPETEGLFAQTIDVDDLAEFIVTAGERRLSGPVNAVGPSLPLADVLQGARTVAGHTGDLVSAPAEWLVAEGVSYWAGPRSLPLWLPADLPGFATRDDRRYRAVGGTARPLHVTLERVLIDERVRGVDRTRAAGLLRSEERALLERL